MTQTANFSNETKCTEGPNWTAREMTAEEIETVKRMVRGYSNVTIGGVHFSDNGVEVNFAVNYLSRAKYPNNHREYQEFRSSEQAE